MLRASSLIGGAQGFNLLIGMVRTKVVALLLGPSGIGLVGLYLSITSLVASFAQLGIDQSGVREVAEANGSGDPVRIAHTVKTLRRICWVTGVLGWLLTAFLAWPLSQWAFGTPARMWMVAILGVTVLLGAVSSGQQALLQGMQCIGDIARIQVLATILNTVSAIGVFIWLGEQGVVPVLILIATINFAVSWRFANRIQPVSVTQTWTETLVNTRRLVLLGTAFMTTALVGSIVPLGIRALILRCIGIEANGVYQASIALSGMFGGFVVAAMAMDFYPRLTAAGEDSSKVNQLVNEQTEIGVLIALPGLLATMVFAPWIIIVFYSSKFAIGAELLPWFVLSVFFRVVSYPMIYILMAKGKVWRHSIFISAILILELACCYIVIPSGGLLGIAIVDAFLYLAYPFGMLILAKQLVAFKYTSGSIRLILISALLLVMGLAVQRWIPHGWAELVGLPLVAGASLLSMRGIVRRLGVTHRIAKIVFRIPGVKFLCDMDFNLDKVTRATPIKKCWQIARFVGWLAEQGIAVLATFVCTTHKRRWRKVANDGPPPWDERNKIIGNLVPSGSSVIDLGCGAQTIKNHIPSDCFYQPCDIVKSTPDAIVCDFNAGVFPDTERIFSHVVCSGVLEYIHDYRRCLRRITIYGKETILSYNPMQNGDSKIQRLRHNWVNHLSRTELENVFFEIELDWQVIHIAANGEIIYTISRRT